MKFRYQAISTLLVLALISVGIFTFSKTGEVGRFDQTAAVADFNSSLIYNSSTSAIQTSFNGTSDRAVTSFNPGITLTNNVTISVWVKPTEIKTGAYMYSSRNSNADRFYLSIKDTFSGGRVAVGLGSWNPTPNSSIIANEWQHYVVILNDTDGSVYRDGQLIASVSGVVKNFPSTTMAMGSDEIASTNSFFPGSIDDLRVYNSALTPDQISQLYSEGT